MPSVLGTDLVISGDQGIIAGIEVKNREALSPEVAAALRRNMIAHGLLPELPFFMLVSQDRAYLWTSASAKVAEAPPAYEIPMRSVLDRYLPEGGIEGRLRGSELELVVRNWLGDLIWGDPDRAPLPAERTLEASGFVKATRKGTITWAVA